MSVVLPASGWDMIAKVRRLWISCLKSAIEIPACYRILHKLKFYHAAPEKATHSCALRVAEGMKPISESKNYNEYDGRSTMGTFFVKIANLFYDSNKKDTDLSRQL